jgi:hypothetical protein
METPSYSKTEQRLVNIISAFGLDPNFIYSEEMPREEITKDNLGNIGIDTGFVGLEKHHLEKLLEENNFSRFNTLISTGFSLQEKNYNFVLINPKTEGQVPLYLLRRIA